MDDKFKLYKKWFWIGIAVGLFNFVAGLIYGIALVIEPAHRKEGLIIIGWSILIFIFLSFYLGPLLIDASILPQLMVVPEKGIQQFLEGQTIPVQ